MTHWTNHDRAAFNEWCNTDLGQKFLAFLRDSRPKLDSELDINKMAMMGAVYTGYEKAIEQIDQMRSITAPKSVEPRPYVKDTHKD
jgi:hypothetical protein